jgi:hypothetical protein
VAPCAKVGEAARRAKASAGGRRNMLISRSLSGKMTRPE